MNGFNSICMKVLGVKMLKTAGNCHARLLIDNYIGLRKFSSGKKRSNRTVFMAGKSRKDSNNTKV